jgi:hypothetical protein
MVARCEFSIWAEMRGEAVWANEVPVRKAETNKQSTVPAYSLQEETFSECTLKLFAVTKAIARLYVWSHVAEQPFHYVKRRAEPAARSLLRRQLELECEVQSKLRMVLMDHWPADVLSECAI